MAIHYVEHVTDDPEGTRAVLTAVGATFQGPHDALGGAWTAEHEGCIVAVRAPMSPDEAPVTRAYTRVDDIDAAFRAVLAAGAEEMLLPVPIEGRGRIAIVGVGGQQIGLWEP